jgi:hypothetical protein
VARWISTSLEYDFDGALVSREGYWHEGDVVQAGGAATRGGSWAFYADGSEAGSVINGTKNVNPTKGDLVNGTVYLFRHGVEEDGGGSWMNAAPQLQYNKNSGGFVDVNASSSNIQSAASGTISDGADTTQRITSGEFTLDSTNEGFDGVDGTAGGATADLTNTGFEALYGFKIIAADVADGDTIVLKVIMVTAGGDLDAYDQTDPTITVEKGANAYTITGASTVNSTVASTMAFNLNASITGASTVGSTIASTMAYNLNASIDGANSVGSTVASTMAYQLNASITSDSTIGSTVASTMAYALNGSITGVSTVTLTIGAALQFGENAITGNVTVGSTIAATMAYQLNASIGGTSTINETIASTLAYMMNASVDGASTITGTVASGVDYTMNASIDGANTVNETIASTMQYQSAAGGDEFSHTRRGMMTGLLSS